MNFTQQSALLNTEFRKHTLSLDLLNTILRFGQVSRFRCKSLESYVKFSSLCMVGICEVELKKVKNKGNYIIKVKE